MTLTGKVQLVEKEGDKQVVVQERQDRQGRELHGHRAQEGQGADRELHQLRAPPRLKRRRPATPPRTPGQAAAEPAAGSRGRSARQRSAWLGTVADALLTPAGHSAITGASRATLGPHRLHTCGAVRSARPMPRQAPVGSGAMPRAEEGVLATPATLAFFATLGVPRMTKRIRAKYKIDRRLGQKHLGPAEEPPQQARVAPRPARRAAHSPSSPTTASSCAPSRS